WATRKPPRLFPAPPANLGVPGFHPDPAADEGAPRAVLGVAGDRGQSGPLASRDCADAEHRTGAARPSFACARTAKVDHQARIGKRCTLAFTLSDEGRRKGAGAGQESCQTARGAAGRIHRTKTAAAASRSAARIRLTPSLHFVDVEPHGARLSLSFGYRQDPVEPVDRGS